MDLARAALFVAVLAAGAALDAEHSLDWFVWALTIATLATTLPYAWSIWLGRRGGVHPRLVMRRHWRVAKWLLPIVFVTFGQEQFVWILAGVALGDEALGGLRAAQYLVGAVAVLLASTENVLPVAASRVHARSGTSAVHSYLQNISFTLAPVICLALAAISFFAKEILVVVFGQEFAQYAPCVEILSVSLLFIFIRDIATIYFRVIQDTATVFRGFLVSFIVTAIIFYPLLLEFGAAGVAATITIGHFTSMIFIVGSVFLRRAGGGRLAARQ